MEPLTVITYLAVFLVIVAVGVARLDVGRCPECAHCRAEAEIRASRDRAAVAALDRRYDLGRCPRCGQTGRHEHDR
jgi:hypothetical protein